MRLGLTFILMLCGTLSIASSVLKVGGSQRAVAVSQDGARPFRVGELVCIYRRIVKLDCGKVVRAGRNMAIVGLRRKNPSLARGNEVLRQDPATFTGPVANSSPPPLMRRPAATLIDSQSPPDEGPTVNNLSAGLSTGLSFFFPILHFERAIGETFALGLMPLYFSTSTTTASATAFGGFGTLSYYGEQYFRGLWLQLGVGAYSLSANNLATSESSISPSVLGTVGWRSSWALGLNVGVALGVQWVSDPSFTSTDIKISGLHPVVQIDLGWAF